MQLCAVISSELTHSQRERFTVLFWWKAQRNLEPEIVILNSTEFVKGTTSIPVLGSTHLTKNTRDKSLIDHGILKITWLLGFPGWEGRLWLWNTRNNVGFGAHNTIHSKMTLELQTSWQKEKGFRTLDLRFRLSGDRGNEIMDFLWGTFRRQDITEQVCRWWNLQTCEGNYLFWISNLPSHKCPRISEPPEKSQEYI